MPTCMTDLSAYMQLCKHPLLSYEEERKLLKAAQSGDMAARNTLILHNQKLVVSIAKALRKYDVEIDDLISEGNLGLAHAITKFDLSRSLRFFSYATWWVKQSMYAYLKERFAIRIPFYLQERISKLRRGRELVYNNKHAEARTKAALYVMTNDPVEYIDEVAAPTADILEAKELCDAALHWMEHLTRREQTVLRHVYFDGLSFRKTGELIGVTRQRTQQICQTALAQLRDWMRDSGP